MLVVKSTTKSYCCSQLAEDVGKELEFFEVHKNVNKHNLAAVSHLITECSQIEHAIALENS
jgi:hypothetical protein